MGGFYRLTPRKVGYRSDQLQSAVVGAGAQVQPAHGCLDERLPYRVQLAERPDFGRAHLGVAGHTFYSFEALSPALAGTFYPCSNSSAGLTQAGICQLFV